MWPSGPISHYAGADTVLPRPKRRKIEIACEVCRLRKSRCDGERPKCGACMKRRNVGPFCVYSEHAYESPLRLAHTVNNASVIRSASLQSPSSPGGTGMGLPGETTVPRQGNDPKTGTIDSPRTSHTNSETLVGPRSGSRDPAFQEQSWMLKAGLLAASSSTSFFNTVFGTSETDRTANDDRNGSNTAFGDKTAPEKVHHSLARTTSLHSTEYLLPPRSVADDLLGMFFKYAYIHWVDRLKFMRWYESLWIGGHRSDDPINEQIYYAHLNISFALAYQSHAGEITDDQDRLAETYFLRAKRALQIDLLELNRLDLIYALLLLIQWYQSVNDVRQCTSLVRLSILIAHNLGLHLPNRIDSLPSQQEREMARRAWHGCILMDRITAMVSGQPLQISQIVARETPLFEAIDDEYLDTGQGEGAQPAETRPFPAFFLAFCKVHIILGDILEKSQHRLHDKRSMVDINHIIEVDKRLEGFLQELPPELRIEKETQDRSLQTGPMIHLHARFLHVKIMLYRPFFVHAANIPKTSGTLPSQPFTEAVTQQGILTCVRCAQEILDLIASRMLADEQGPHLLPQRWHTVTYVYTATTILIAAHIFSGLVKDVTASGLASSIAQGFQILDHQSENNNEAAKRCKMALNTLYEKHGKLEKSSGQQPRSSPDHVDSSVHVHPSAEFGWDFPDTTGDLWSSEGMESLLYNTNIFAPEGGGWF